MDEGLEGQREGAGYGGREDVSYLGREDAD